MNEIVKHSEEVKKVVTDVMIGAGTAGGPAIAYISYINDFSPVLTVGSFCVGLGAAHLFFNSGDDDE